MYRFMFFIAFTILFFISDSIAADVVCTWDLKVKSMKQVNISENNRQITFNKVIDNHVVSGTCDYFTSHSIVCPKEQDTFVTFETGRLYVVENGKLVRYDLGGKTFDKMSFDYLIKLRRCDIFY